MQLQHGHLYRLFFDWPNPRMYSESIWRCIVVGFKTSFLRIASTGDGPFDRYDIQPNWYEALEQHHTLPYPAWQGNVFHHENFYPHLVTEIQPDELLANIHLPFKTHRWDEVFRA